MTTERPPIEIESADDEGLLGLVTRAEHAVLDSTTEPVGVLRLELVRPHDESSPEHPLVAVEAAFVERAGSGVVERLEVHYCRRLDQPVEPSLLAGVLEGSGGSEYTSLCLRDDERELLDATLHFGSVIKLFGTCTALIADRLSPEQVSACRFVLAALGVGLRESGGELTASRRRLGGTPGVSAQVAVIERARERGLDVALYASTLPLTRSARLAIAGPTDAARLYVSLSRQIPREATSIARDAVALRELVSRQLAFDFGGQRWRVENAHGERVEHRAHGPLSGGGPVHWSLNWGAKRS
ncbi:MAG: hypothetical protein IPI67_00180 [Myxococcales bacterium]|nr:hypothetical protein [Myxococcales bacterium]